MTEPTLNLNSLGSSMIQAFERAYHSVREANPDLPANVVFVLGSGISRVGVTYGTFTPNAWQMREDGLQGPPRAHEIMISGQCIAQGARMVLDTILHEAAHALAHVRGIKDTARDQRVHNRRFLKLANELGLEWLRHPDGSRRFADKSTGFDGVVLSDRTADDYADELALIHAAITVAIEE